MKKDSASLKRVVRDILAMAGEEERAGAAAPREIENDFQHTARREVESSSPLSRRPMIKI
jgi:hypothetical protein